MSAWARLLLSAKPRSTRVTSARCLGAGERLPDIGLGPLAGLRGIGPAQSGEGHLGEVEGEYLTHDPTNDQFRFDPEGKVTPPQGSFITLSIRANAQGEVTIGLPKAGWWGICALDLDDGLEHNDKDLSLDAVLWVKATDMTN